MELENIVLKNWGLEKAKIVNEYNVKGKIVNEIKR